MHFGKLALYRLKFESHFLHKENKNYNFYYNHWNLHSSCLQTTHLTFQNHIKYWVRSAFSHRASCSETVDLTSGKLRGRFLRLYIYQRITEVGWHLWGLPNSTPCPNQGHLQHVAQGCVQSGIKYFQRWKLHLLSGQPGILIID